ncbi:MAG: CapA family protein, partial [Bdellovibrionales bacterium]|nr:CapA family protein [Bdellovibrionales bacterium]
FSLNGGLLRSRAGAGIAFNRQVYRQRTLRLIFFQNRILYILGFGLGCVSQSLWAQVAFQPQAENGIYSQKRQAGEIEMVVTAQDGIPVFKTTSTEEADICGQLSLGDKVFVQKKRNQPLPFELIKIRLEKAVGNCRQIAYVQTGFLMDPYYAGNGGKQSTGSRSWKSSIPQFETRCEERRGNNKIIISFVGDVLLHGPLQQQAYSQSGRFQTLWDQLNPVFKDADIAYANLEGPAAEGVNCQGQMTKKNQMVLDPQCGKSRSSVYTSYPMFNYHPSVTEDLVTSGFDIVSTANNHVLDRYSNGVDQTIDALQRSGLAFMGTRKQFSDSGFYTVTRTRSRGGQVFNIAWVACTFSANGFVDKKNQVLNCYNYGKNGSPIFSQTNPEVLSLVGRLANTKGIDGVIVTPHWGPTEYTHSVHSSQSRLAYELVESGATAVIGAHPHVLQPWEVIKTNSGREGFVHYSLGNFVSNQKQANRRASLVLLVGFQKDGRGQLRVDGVRYIPTYLNSWGGGRYSRELIPLDRGKQANAQGRESLKSTLSLFPDELRLNSTDELSTCY